MLTPRKYQSQAHDAAWEFIRTSTDPCLIEAATGAGKSIIVALLADTIHKHSGKRVLCLCPSGELVSQNGEKMKAAGIAHSLFSASLGRKSLRHPIVIGTPGTIKNSLSRFGAEFGAIVIDEAHGLTPTLIKIIDCIRDHNPNVRVVGMTATPYRMGGGYIFAMYPDGKPVPEHQTRDPFFTQLVYRITAQDLLEQKFLTPVTVGMIGASKYDTSGLELGRNGQFTASSLDRAYNGHGRKTAGIVADIVAQSRDRKSVMLFCATVQHAHEALASLPPEISGIVTGNTPKDERNRIIARFKSEKIKYLVNVSVLTTGFDAPSVDVVALLRKTESAGLLQQIIGRSLRLDDGKKDALLLDYSDNIETHFPDGDIFNPDIRVPLVSGELPPMNCACPECGTSNEFRSRKNPDGYEADSEGYFLDLAGDRIESEYGPIPAHTGRRCMGLSKAGATWVRCGYRWTSKTCGACGEANDIAARYCFSCKNELVDPGEKLRLEFKALKRDPTKVQTDKVVEMEVAKMINRKGKEMWKVTWLSEFRSFQTHHFATPENQWQYADYERLMSATKGLKEKPDTVTYQKDQKSGFYKVLAFGMPEDKMEVA